MSVDEARRVFADAPFRWWISGGHALELHVGAHWRAHDDLDVGICRYQADLVHAWLGDWELHVASGGRLAPWDGRPLSSDQDENNVWVRRSPDARWAIDLMVGDGDEHRWIYRRDPSVTRPWHRTVRRTASGVPHLAPEIQLLFKSPRPRPKDDIDAVRVIPTLDPRAREFLADQIGHDHPWQRLLGA